MIFNKLLLLNNKKVEQINEHLRQELIDKYEIKIVRKKYIKKCP